MDDHYWGLYSYGSGYRSHSNIYQYLVSKGADVDAFELDVPVKPMVPLLASLGLNMDGHTDEEERDAMICKKILLDADANLRNSQAFGGYSYSAVIDAVSQLHLDMVRVILDHGGLIDDIDDRDNNGNTAFLRAALISPYGYTINIKYPVENSFAVIKLLMVHGVDYKSVNNSGENFFHIILRKEFYSDSIRHIFRPHNMLTAVLVRVIEGGRDILAVDACGKTPSHVAKDSDYEHSWMEALLRYGYSPQEVYAKSGVP
ncbi:hypothetical protein ACMFMG_011321 [Clarireedia jacksonii]